MHDSIFDGYDHRGFYDEVFDDEGSIRPHYRALVERLAELSPDELVRRERLRDESFRNQGITFTVYGESEGIERSVPDGPPSPGHPADEWKTIEAGLIQRVKTLNDFLDDLLLITQL